jgi:hypothetical protein
MFSDLHLEIAEAQSQGSHVMLMGGFNAHLDHEPDTFSEQNSYLSEYFPQLKQTRMRQKSNIRTNMAGRCLLDISATIPFIITTGRGKGDIGQPTYFGYNSIAGNAPTPTRTEHLAMTPILYAHCQDIGVEEDFYLADHKPLTCLFNPDGCLAHIDTRLTQGAKQRYEHKLLWKQELCGDYVANIQTNETELQAYYGAIQGGDANAAYGHFTTLILHAAERAGMIAKPQPLRARMGLPMAPWFDDTCKAYKAQVRSLAKSDCP